MGKVLLKNAVVLDVENQKSLDKHCVLIEDGLIAAIAPDLEDGEAKVYDLQGKTVTPGFFNCHVHIFGVGNDKPPMHVPGDTAKTTITCINSLNKLLSCGVTFIRDGGAPEYIDVCIRGSVKAGLIDGPDMLVCGKPICVTGGNMNQLGGVADGPDAAREMARINIEAGADWVKVMSTGGIMSPGTPGAAQMSVEELEAVVNEAHKAGKKVFSHAQGAEGIKRSLSAGIDSIEHGFYLDDESVAFMREHNVFYVPTLEAFDVVEKNADAPGMMPPLLERSRLVKPEHVASFKKALEAGVKIALGTDAGTPYNPHEKSLEELVLFVESGMSTWEALKAGTLCSAELCGVLDTLGSISVGKRAHLAVFNGNPAEDIRNALDCVMTFIDGRLVYEK